MKKPSLIITALCSILVACLIALAQRTENDAEQAHLTFYCAAGLRKPVSEIVNTYSAETGRKVRLIFNGSGALLSQIKIGKGDLFMPADLSYIKRAPEDKLTSDVLPVSQLTAVIVVHKDNTTITSLDDLTKPGVRLALADNTAAIGHFTRSVLSENGMLQSIEKNVIVTKPTVNNIVEDVSLGSVDATIAWAPVARNFPNLRTIHAPIFTHRPRTAAVALLRSSKTPKDAMRLAHYLAAKDKGQAIFKKYGFTQKLQ